MRDHLQIPKATNIPMADLEKALRMTAQDFEQHYRIAKPRPTDPVIFLCKGGVRAAEANDVTRFALLLLRPISGFIEGECLARFDLDLAELIDTNLVVCFTEIYFL